MNFFKTAKESADWNSIVPCSILLALLLNTTSAYSTTNISVVTKFPIPTTVARINVTGVVKDNKGEPLPGVSVKIKGTTTGTSTDANGVFRINLPVGNETLVFSFIGFKTQEVPVNGKTTIDVSLAESSSELNEVVIVGYGTQKKATLTGAISTVDLKQVEDIPALNMNAVLKGTAPALNISGGAQRPGQGTSVTIRNPLAYSKDGPYGVSPLFVIDDVIRTQSDFELLDPALVESVSVLKDAEAAIYGVQGANGVIIVRTRKGRTGAPKFSLSTSVGASDATMLPRMMSAYELGTYMNDFYQGQAASGSYPTGNQSYLVDPSTFNAAYYTADGYLVKPGYTNTNGVLYGTGNNTTETSRYANWYTPDELEYFSTHSHNYLDEAFKTAYVERTALNLSGGTDKINYFIGGDYVNQNSNFKGINSYKYGLRANVEAKPAKGLTTSLSISTDVSYSKSYWYKLRSTSESLDNDAASLQNVQPWQEYFIDGNPVLLGASTGGGYDNLNFFLVQNSNNYTGTKSYITNILGKISYEIPKVKGLSANFTINKNINSSNNKQFGTTFNYYQYSGQGTNKHIPGGTLVNSFSISNGDKVRLNPTFTDSYQLNAGLTYDRSFGKHSITALALFEQREQSTEGVAAEVAGIVTGGLDYQSFATGAQSSDQAGRASEFGFQSVITRLNYSYANKYLAQLVYRADGSSRFAPGNNWGGFPAASLGWVASEEPFVKNALPWFDLLKFRVSAGLTGTDNTKSYQYLANYTVGTGNNGGAVFDEKDRGNGIRANIAIPNRNVTWDHVFKSNYGVDMQFLRSRLSVSADYFWNHAYNMLTSLSASVPATIGANVPTENYGIVNMFGYELAASWKDRKGKLSYSFSPFFSWSDNKQVRYDLESGKVGTLEDLTGKSNDPGVFGYKSLGIIRSYEEANAIISERSAAAGGNTNVKIFGAPIQPGMINYQDVNGDGIVDAKDRQYLTRKQSNHNNLGLNFGLGYGSLNMNVIMGLSWGGWTSIDGIKPFRQSSGSTNASIADNRPAYWVDHWTPSNPNAKYPAPYYVSNYDVTTDFWLVKATTFNVSSINLSYSLPTRLTQKVGISNARVYAVATNPIQFINPFPNSYRDSQTPLYTYPTLKTVSLGVNVGF